jgi:hypothetical protein
MDNMNVIGGQKVVHVRRLNRLWWAPVDTRRWPKLVAINELNGTERDDRLLEFFHVDGTWWACRHAFFDDEENGMVEYWSEVHEPTVARNHLEHLGVLPPELEKWRPIAADMELHRRWLQENGATPDWDNEARVLSFGGVVIIKYRDKSYNQMELWNQFQGRGWPPLIPDPFEDLDTLKDTLRACKKKLGGAPRSIRLFREGDQVGWRHA